uniref:Uncharacterized protein n=1 Tax=Magallana gigas TaxID=29159 RepID=K1Q234_MAGGI
MFGFVIGFGVYLNKRECVMTLAQDHLDKANVTGRKVQTSCLVHIFLMDKYWKFLIHIKIAYNLRVCHDLDPRSIEEVQANETGAPEGQQLVEDNKDEEADDKEKNETEDIGHKKRKQKRMTFQTLN